MKKSLILSVALSLLCVVMSCKKSDSTNNTTTSPSFVGTWEKSSGSVNLTLYVTDKTHFSYDYYDFIGGNTGTISGTYSTSGTEATFKETSSNAACLNVPGKYSYSVDSTHLTLVLINDSCNGALGQRSSLVTGRWDKI